MTYVPEKFRGEMNAAQERKRFYQEESAALGKPLDKVRVDPRLVPE